MRRKKQIAGQLSLVRFFFAKEMNDLPTPLIFLSFHETFGHSSKRKIGIKL